VRQGATERKINDEKKICGKTERPDGKRIEEKKIRDRDIKKCQERPIDQRGGGLGGWTGRKVRLVSSTWK